MTGATVQRERIEVPGARDVLDRHHERVAAGTPIGVAAARSLVEHRVAWDTIRGDIVGADRSIIVAQHPSGAVLAVRHFASLAPTSIHDHGFAGAALVVEGRDRYERFTRRSDTEAAVVSIHDLAVGDVIWWDEPPADVHRQHGLDDGAIELVLVAGPSDGVSELIDVTPTPSPLRADVVQGYLDGDRARLAPWYADDVVLDANVPEWRFQVTGREPVLDLLSHEELETADRRVTFLRATDTADGLLLETESRFRSNGDARVCRQSHVLRIFHDRIVGHTVWCTGVASGSDARRQLMTAPMERA